MFNFKILVVGGPSVGKTSIIIRLFGGEFPDVYQPTVGFVVYPTSFNVSNREYGVDIWDVGSNILTSIKDRDFIMTDDVKGVIFVFDMGNSLSLGVLDKWYNLLAEYLPFDIPKILLAHKADSPVWAVPPKLIDRYVEKAGISDWFLTVGNPLYGDYASQRGSGAHQRTPADAMQTLLKRILHYESMFSQQKQQRSLIDDLNPLLPPLRIECTDETELVLSLSDLCTLPSGRSTAENERESNETLSTDTGWQHFAGVMSRVDAETLLEGRNTGSFLVRQSDQSDGYRVTIKNHVGDIVHVPVKVEDNFLRVGRLELRETRYQTLADALAALELYPTFGLRFDSSTMASV